MLGVISILFSIGVMYIIMIYPKALLLQVIEHESAIASGEKGETRKAFILGSIPFINDIYLSAELNLKILKVLHIILTVLLIPVVINTIILTVIQPTSGGWLIGTRLLNVLFVAFLYVLQVITAGRILMMFTKPGWVFVSVFPPLAYVGAYYNAPKFYKETADIISDRFKRRR